MTADLASGQRLVIQAKRYAPRTLGEDKEIAAAVRELSPKVITIMEGISVRKREFDRRTSDLQKAVENFRDLADKRFGNVAEPWQELDRTLSFPT